ncbi:hypothetical protein KY348_04815 [Candidatus Woesearchaeota archaeon]|nr:hypothetical protein [Candidatus Woesearchaeota archaeon]
MNKKYFIILIGFLVLIIFISGCKAPVCGDGIVEEGETSTTCCLDAGCVGEQTCENNTCTEPVCGECQFLDEHMCMDYDCCSHDVCQDDEVCSDHECVKLTCLECEHPENHICVGYTCCSDSDCNDNNPSTIDTCVNPKTVSSSCSNVLADECTSNSDCDDNDVSTEDVCSGTPKKCSNTRITECISGDDYCPSNCDYNDDDDCEIQEIDCRKDFDCFIEASENCELAEVTHIASIDFLGVTTTSTTLMEIQGMDEDKCVYYQKTKSISVEFSEELKQQMRDGGATEEEINQAEQDANENAQQAVGERKTCKFDTSDLTALLEEWDAGNFSTEDFDVAECEE